MLVTKQLIYPIDFHSLERKKKKGNGISSTVWLPTFFKKSASCFKGLEVCLDYSVRLQKCHRKGLSLYHLEAD